MNKCDSHCQTSHKRPLILTEDQSKIQKDLVDEEDGSHIMES